MLIYIAAGSAVCLLTYAAWKLTLWGTRRVILPPDQERQPAALGMRVLRWLLPRWPARMPGGFWLEQVIPLDNARRLNAQIQTGSINVMTDSSDTLRITAKILAVSQVEWKRLEETPPFQIERDNDAIILDGVRNAPAGRVNRALDLTLHIPPGLSADLSVQTGRVTAQGSFSNLSAEVTTGQVSVPDVSILGDRLDAEVTTGEVTVSVSQLPAECLNIRAMTGQAMLRLPLDAQATVRMDVKIGKLQADHPAGTGRPGMVIGSGTMQRELNGGGTDIRMSVGTGSAMLHQWKDRGAQLLLRPAAAPDNPAETLLRPAEGCAGSADVSRLLRPDDGEAREEETAGTRDNREETQIITLQQENRA